MLLLCSKKPRKDRRMRRSNGAAEPRVLVTAFSQQVCPQQRCIIPSTDFTSVSKQHTMSRRGRSESGVGWN
jgi:hypothetical protein